MIEEKVKKKDCCGCSGCVQICPKQCIAMKMDTEGFWYPVVDKKKCVNCGLCKTVCPIMNVKSRKERVISAYAGYCKDENIRLKSSSGGLFSMIAEYVLERQGVVFGAAFDKMQRVYHIGVIDKEELVLLRGSKYVQSNVGNTYMEAKKFLEQGKYVLYTGTACQISGLKQFLGKDYDKLLTVDVLCHGVPSPKVWQKYLDTHIEHNGCAVQQMFFRQKYFGWKTYAVELQFSNSTAYVKKATEDTFMRLFLGNICLRPSCHACQFKQLERDSDLTIGDAWGINKVMPELDDDKGTSVILVHTKKGELLIEHLREKLVIKEGNVDKLLSKTADSRKSVAEHPKRRIFFERMEKGDKLDELVCLLELTFFQKCIRKLKRGIRKICSIGE